MPGQTHPHRAARALGYLTAAIVTTLLLAACGGNDSGASSTTLPPPPPALAELVPLASLDRPTTVAARAGTDDLYVTLQADGVQILHPAGDGTYDPDPDLLIDRTEADFDAEEYVEAGVLGLTFSDDGAQLYLVESLPTGNPESDREVRWRLLEYTLEGNDVVDGTERVLLDIVKERPVHNAGQVRFGPDGYLYIGLGDGSAVGDKLEAGQDRQQLFGKIMRIDPTPGPNGEPYTIPADNPFADGVDGAPEVWLYGVRNPWRFTWDPEDGDLWLTDVGNAEIEEVNRLAPGTDRGANLGWSEVEGTQPFEGGTAPPEAVSPLFEYEHEAGRCAIIGGAPVRGGAVAELEGWYLYSDFCALEIFAIDPEADPIEPRYVAPTDASVTSIEAMADGQILVLTLDGLFELAPYEP